MEITLSQTKFKPAFVGRGWGVWGGPSKGNGFGAIWERERRESPATSVELVEPFVVYDDCANGEELFRRLIVAGKFCPAERLFLTLWEEYCADRRSSFLETKVPADITTLAFPGLILRAPQGGRFMLTHYRCGNNHWCWRPKSLADPCYCGECQGYLNVYHALVQVSGEAITFPPEVVHLT